MNLERYFDVLVLEVGPDVFQLCRPLETRRNTTLPVHGRKMWHPSALRLADSVHRSGPRRVNVSLNLKIFLNRP